MRQPCREAFCRGLKGKIFVRGGQNTVRCLICGTYAGYNAPKTETGQRRRNVSTVRNVTPSARAEVLVRARGRCELCAVELPPLGWHLAHLFPRRLAIEENIPDEVTNGPKNLAAFCEECNLGYKDMVDPLLWLVILRRRLR